MRVTEAINIFIKCIKKGPLTQPEAFLRLMFTLIITRNPPGPFYLRSGIFLRGEEEATDARTVILEITFSLCFIDLGYNLL